MPVLSLNSGLVMLLRVSLRELGKLHLEACVSSQHSSVCVCWSYKQCQNLFSLPHGHIEFLSIGVMEWSERASGLPLPCLPVQSSAPSLRCMVTSAQPAPGQHPLAVQRVQDQTETLHMEAENHRLLVDASPPQTVTLSKRPVCLPGNAFGKRSNSAYD